MDMNKLLTNIYARLVALIATYFFLFAVVLLQANTILLEYIGVHGWFLYVVMFEHFVIAIIFGLFWLKLTGINPKSAVLSSLILPTSFFTITLIHEYFVPTPHENVLLVIGFLAVSQYMGIVIGSSNSHRTLKA